MEKVNSCASSIVEKPHQSASKKISQKEQDPLIESKPSEEKSHSDSAEITSSAKTTKKSKILELQFESLLELLPKIQERDDNGVSVETISTPSSSMQVTSNGQEVCGASEEQSHESKPIELSEIFGAPLPGPKKQNELSLEKKMEVINFRRANPKLGGRPVSRIFGCSKSQIHRIWNNQDQIEKEAQRKGLLGYPADRKRIFHRTKWTELNEAIFEWHFSELEKNSEIDSPTLKLKALEMAARLGLKDFKASNQWLKNYQTRIFDARIRLLAADNGLGGADTAASQTISAAPSRLINELSGSPTDRTDGRTDRRAVKRRTSDGPTPGLNEDIMIEGSKSWGFSSPFPSMSESILEQQGQSISIISPQKEENSLNGLSPSEENVTSDVADVFDNAKSPEESKIWDLKFEKFLELLPTKQERDDHDVSIERLLRVESTSNGDRELYRNNDVKSVSNLSEQKNISIDGAESISTSILNGQEICMKIEEQSDEIKPMNLKEVFGDPSPSPKKSNELSLEKKMEVINFRRANPKLGGRPVSRIFGCSKSQIHRIWNNQDQIEREAQRKGLLGYPADRKRIFHRTKWTELNEAIFEWHFSELEKNSRIDSPTLKSKALEMAERFGLKDFKASNQWLKNYQTRIFDAKTRLLASGIDTLDVVDTLPCQNNSALPKHRISDH